MKRDGFTLIELLAVIVVLGIIMLIAVTAVNGIITKSRLSSFNTSSKMLEKAASTYINATNTIVASGTTTTVLYSNLKSSGYMNQIVDPISKTECTNSRVYVTNIGGTYTYKGAVACNNYMDIDSYNQITNSDFSNGSTSWSNLYSSLNVTNNILSVTGDGTGNSANAFQSTNITTATSKKVYTRVKIRVTNPNSIDINIRGQGTTSGSSTAFITQSNPTQNQWYTLSGIWTVDVAQAGNVRIYARANYVDATTANGKTMQVDGTNGVYVFDLTTIYGAGNEPTAAQMDKVMSNMGK